MRKIASYLLLSLFLMAGTSSAYADHRNDHREGFKKEHHKDHKKDSKKAGKEHEKRMKKGEKRHDKWDKKPGNLRPGPAPINRPGNHRPGPAPKPVYRPGGNHHGASPVMAPPPPPRLEHMVKHACRGGKFVDVWRVSHDTYVVKYRKGNRYYTRYLYPYAERYGNPALISINWQPQTPWVLIPPIQLNINI